MSYVLMKALESAPSRYDKGINLITLGRVSKAYDHLACFIKAGWDVLDIGCGTGAVALRAAAQGAHVTGIDVSPWMLEIAGKRAQETELSGNMELREQGVAELSSLPAGQYDAVTAGLVFSELTDDERAYALRQLRRVLKDCGLLLIVDETVPPGFFRQIPYWLMRVPLTILTYVLTQTTTRPMRHLPEMVAQAGFVVEETLGSGLGDLTELVCRNQEGQP